MNCKYCGAPLGEEVDYCLSCGKAQSTDVPAGRRRGGASKKRRYRNYRNLKLVAAIVVVLIFGYFAIGLVYTLYPGLSDGFFWPWSMPWPRVA